MGGRKKYKREEFVAYLQALVDADGRSMRKISLAAGQDHSAVRRILKLGTRPSQDACIAFAHLFDIDPNEFLQRAGYEPLAFFDLSLADPNEFSPDVKEVARELMKIEDINVRRRVSSSVLRLVREMFTGAGE